MSNLDYRDSERTPTSEIVEEATRAIEEYETIALPDGRQLAYAEFGDPDGEPVFYFHGFPGSRAQAAPASPIARELGVRVIAPDRPGMGASDPLPRRKLVDWPADVVALADALGISEFAVFGISGGGPYAAACAAKIPERVRAASIVSSVAPLEATSSRGFRLPFQLSRYAPPLAKLLFWWQGRGAEDSLDAAVEARAADASAADAEYWRAPFGRAVLLSTGPATENGVGPLVREAAIYARPWRFDLGGIAVPTFVWHGEADENVPVEMGRYLADRIPTRRTHVLPGEGHLSTPAEYMTEILLELLER